MSLDASAFKPRCRERNRRWRKSHHNKNLSASRFKQRNKNVQTFLDADRKILSAETFRDIKNRQIRRVHAGFATPLENASAFSRGITNTLFLNLFRKQRICFLNFRLFANPKSKI
jgi:hypothetical protein